MLCTVIIQAPRGDGYDRASERSYTSALEHDVCQTILTLRGAADPADGALCDCPSAVTLYAKCRSG
jgi:hypothetical protein